MVTGLLRRRLRAVSLRARVHWALFGFGAATALILVIGALMLDETLERLVIQGTLQAEAARTAPALRSPHPETRDNALLRHYGASAPDALRHLAPGFHEGVALNGRYYYVLVREAAGHREIVAYDTTRLRAREHWFAGALALTLVVIFLAAHRFGRSTAERLTRPLARLAQTVHRIDPASRNSRIPTDQGDPELSHIATAFNAYLARMDDFVAREQAFIRSASHELRTPLAVVGGAVDVLRARGLDRDGAAGPLERIERATRTMTETVDALLALARREAAAHETSPCRADRLLNAAVGAQRELAAQRGLTLTLGACEPTTVHASARMLAMLMENLLRNALENTDRGTVTASVRAGTLSVVDTGSGLDPDTARRFLRGAGPAERVRGHGIGLYVVGQICAHHGWKVTFEPNPAGGTAVTVRLEAAVAS